jgi:para-nitrobenzyl esterase
MRFFCRRALLASFVLLSVVAVAHASDVVQTVNGPVEGRGAQPSGVRIFRGIPFAQPPTGELRWREPQPVKNWKEVRPATEFGPRCMQAPIYSDMVFRSNGMSEDCLYLNVWTPAKANSERLPVLVYFYGGGFVTGDGSEPRYDGESMAAKGIVVVTVNYRLGIFGFLALAELTQESPHKASGNYGFLDQNAALRWVNQNIANFGGDPKRVTIAGESAGSISVSAQMASPLSRELIAGAIGESGAMMGNLGLSPVSLAKAEDEGRKFVTRLGSGLEALRAVPAEKVLAEASSGGMTSVGRFPLSIDGYFLPEAPSQIYAAGKQAHVPLLAGWNSEELTWRAMISEPTPEQYKKLLGILYQDRADEAFKVYPATTRDEIIQAATDIAGDRFIAYSTWKWIDLHVRTGDAAVYRYLFARPRPALRPEVAKTLGPNAPPPARGAVHSGEIEYALGNLKLNDVYAWTDDDYRVSTTMQNYFANFIKTGDPNGGRLPKWPPMRGSAENAQLMRLDVRSGAEPDKTRARYLFHEQILH